MVIVSSYLEVPKLGLKKTHNHIEYLLYRFKLTDTYQTNVKIIDDCLLVVLNDTSKVMLM